MVARNLPNLHMNRNDTKICATWPPPPIPPTQTALTSCANILSLARWYSSSRSSIDLLLLSAFKRIRIWQGHTQAWMHATAHTHFFSSKQCQGRQIVPLFPTCQEWKWQLGWGRERERKKNKKTKNTYRAVFAIKAGVVSFENVAFLKIVRPVIFDVLGEFLIGSVDWGGGCTIVLMTAWCKDDMYGKSC